MTYTALLQQSIAFQTHMPLSLSLSLSLFSLGSAVTLHPSFSKDHEKVVEMAYAFLYRPSDFEQPSIQTPCENAASPPRI